MPLWYNGIRLRVKKQTAISGTPPSGFGDLWLPSNRGIFSLKDNTGLSKGLPPQTVLLHNLTTTNEGGGFKLDVNSQLALDCAHLEIWAMLRSGVSATSDVIYLSYNDDQNDTNYKYGYSVFNEAAAVASNSNGATRAGGFVSAANSGSNEYSFYRIWIPWFQSVTEYKSVRIRGDYSIGSTNMTGIFVRQRWVKLDAITNVRIRVDGYTTDSFNSNSRVLVWGHKL